MAEIWRCDGKDCTNEIRLVGQDPAWYTLKIGLIAQHYCCLAHIPNGSAP